MASPFLSPLLSPQFQCAFLAMSYFWGSRSSSLADTLAPHALQPAAAELLSGLEHPERSVRAAALGAELAKLSAALEKRGLVR